ncbi:MAG: hypothetical protein JRF43_06155 [Deltaproteobacteria bacterium]|nr:hypothetical protein [Deltaproteobacteria bacterium]
MSFFRKVSALWIFLLISLSFGLPSAHAQDGVTYLGDLCWEIRSQGDSEVEQPNILQLGIMSYGAGHFPVHGKKICGDYIQVMHGNAELWDGKVEITLTGTELDPQILPTTMHIILNLPDFEGTFHEMYWESGTSPPYQIETEQGTLTLTACP